MSKESLTRSARFAVAVAGSVLLVANILLGAAGVGVVAWWGQLCVLAVCFVIAPEALEWLSQRELERVTAIREAERRQVLEQTSEMNVAAEREREPEPEPEQDDAVRA